MKRYAKRLALTTLASAATAFSLIGLTSTGAFAINSVPCDNDEYVKLSAHAQESTDVDLCYANGGETITPNDYPWATQIWTGNNRVQYFADGLWQPDQPIGQWTRYYWPHNPGGIHIEGIRIV